MQPLYRRCARRATADNARQNSYSPSPTDASRSPLFYTPIVDDDVEVTCPYCGEPNTVSIDAGGEGDEFVQDCSVCCRPWQVRITIRPDGSADVSVRAEGE